MYVDPNFKTKKLLKEAIKEGKEVIVYQPNDMFGVGPPTGTVCVEGPHYPQPHTWYAQVEAKNGKVVRFIS